MINKKSFIVIICLYLSTVVDFFDSLYYSTKYIPRDISSSEYDSQDEESSEFYESSDSSKDSGNLIDNDNEDNETIREWNYNIPKRKLKLFKNKSNNSHQTDFKFHPIDTFKLLFTEQLFEFILKQTNVYGQQKNGFQSV